MREALFLSVSAQHFSQDFGFLGGAAQTSYVCANRSAVWVGSTGSHCRGLPTATQPQRTRLARLTPKQAPPPRRRTRAAQTGSTNPNHAETPVARFWGPPTINGEALGTR